MSVRSLFFLCFLYRWRRTSSAGVKIVQIMGDIVAEAAFREFGQHGCGVTIAVTALTLRYHFVFCLMAGDAAQIFMFESSGRQKLRRLFVAGSTIFGRSFIIVSDVLRRVRLMTFFAVGSGLFGEMSFMTLGAIRNFTMRIVAETAGKSRVLALVVAQFDDLAGMAGETGVSDVIAVGDFERGMGIRMTAHAGCQPVVRFSFVALAAERYDFPGCGGVSVVAVLTADLGFVLAAICGNVIRRFAMTFGAVFKEQLGRGCYYRFCGAERVRNS
jgi:hypothetical protein